MNTTFTTCAEKKAKPFLNLLQGYTKGIRMTAILILLLMGVNNAWGLEYNDESHVYLDVNGTTKYYKVSAQSWNTGCSLPGTWGGELNSQTFNDVQNLTIKGGAVGGKTAWQESLSATLSYSVTTSTTTPSSWTNFGSITSSSIYKNDACFYYKNNGSTNVTPTTPGTYYLHIKISFNSTSKTSYAKFTIPASTYTVAGSEAVLGSNWKQSDTNNDMTLSSGTTYTLTKHDVSLTKGTDYECKVVKDHNWDNAWPSNNYVFSVNTTGHYDVTFTFDSSTKEVSVTSTRLYAVIYNGNSNTSGSVPATTYHKSESTITVANNSGNLAKSGYTFEGWNENADGTGTSYAVGSTFSMPSADKTLYAKWTLSEQQFNVTAVANPTKGGTVTPTTATPMGQTSGGTITATANTGYTFNNWTIQSGSGSFTDATAASTTFKPTAVSTVQANFTANKYTVKFHENGGKGEMADQGFTYGVAQKLTENAFTRTNALFVGWATSENGTVTYTDGQSVSNLTTTKDGVVNLYAVWATISITACPERIRLNDQLTLTISYKNIPENYIYRVYITNHNQPVPNNTGEWITITGSGTLTHTSQSGHNFNVGENNIVVDLYNQNHTLLLRSEAKTFIAEQINNIAVYYNTGNGNMLYKDITGVSETFGATVSAQDIITEKGIVGYKFTNWSIISGTIEFDPNINSETVTITATTGGQIIAHFEELQPKTIYLKTVEDTKDGDKWFVVYGGQEYEMTPLGCTGEYYRGVVPEGTSFHFVSKDNNDTQVETKGSDLQYVEGKTLYNLVSAAASGNKIFFKPNENWKNSASTNNYYFAACFWTGSAVWKEMTDDDADGIYECEKPANAKQVIFCLVNTKENIDTWGDVWDKKKIQTDGDNKYKLIPNGSNYFTITDDKVDQATGTWSTHADEWTTFTGITYRITFDQQEATTAGTTHVDVAYHASMPEIEKLPTTTEKKFGGYYTQQNGQGVMLVNAFGEWQDANGYISSTTWEREGCVTLYAYWKDLTPEITDVILNTDIFEPVDENKEGFVTAKPIINEHSNTTLTYVVCWKLLYTNGREVEGHNASTEGCEQNQVKFSIAGLSTGTYTIRASLHTGNDCGSGEEISRFDKQFSIVANRTITVNYTCDNQEIKASTTAPAQATETTDITAPDIFGYTFKEWTLGDGVSSESTLTDKTISYTAIYDGTITAKYTKRKLIYLDLSQEFSESGKWSDPYIYLYGSNGYWSDEKGAGATGDACKAKGAMTKIEGTDIWYYDYSNVAGFTKYLAFTWGNHTSAENFYNCDVIYRGDFSEGTPLFVPAIDQTKEEKNGAKYYSKGYWVNYIGEHTGYTLIIYNQAGNTELIRQKFTSANKRMNMTSVIDLEAEHKYQYEVLRDYGYYYKYNSSELTNTNKGPKPLNTADKGTIVTTAAGDYTFTLGYWSGDLQISVDYPAAVGDYRILYRDNGTTNWSGNPRPQNWCHPSRIIKKKDGANDTISFFINKDKEPQLLYQTIKSINASTGAITWNAAKVFEDVKWNVIEKDGVINFTFTQSKGAIAVTNIELYKGNYYIRVDAVDGKWGNYKTDPDNRMTYSAFSESDANSFGEKFSHYKTQWCPRGTNVKFTIANDYSPCITDTLIRDVTKTWEENMDEHGKLKSDGSQYPTADKYSANIRFMWNRTTNKISRAYLSSATNVTKKFLILQGDDKMKNAEGEEIAATEHVPEDATLLDDKQNWIYETTIKVQPGARVKLYACYTKTEVEEAQYFRGKKGEFNEVNTVQILGGTGETWNTMRVIYDFKTNRLMGAWVPDTEIGDNGLQIDADIMIMREHQEEATCINLTENANSKLTDVKTVYGVMRFNRWILNNRANPKDLDVDHCSTFDGKDRNYDEEKVKLHHPVLQPADQKSQYERALYFISFPFNVNVSDIFGFGTYGQHWIIEYYDGLKRAREGFWIDSDPNWKYVTNPDEFVLEKYKGYILCLNLGKMAYNNTDFWAHNISQVELFFPSTTTMSEIKRTEVTMPELGDEYLCKINRNTPEGDRRVKDSYWRCIGVPSYANYSNVLKDEEGDPIQWQTSYEQFPFLYAWNMTDNTLTPQSTTNFNFKTMHAYLVQNGGEIHWSAVSATPNPPSNIVARRQAADEVKNYEWKLTLSRNEQIEDQTFVRLSDNEQITTEFDFNQDLSKEFNYGRSDIYTLIGYEKAAANSLPITETTTLIPLGLSIEYNGDYTIAMPDRMENIGVTLIDTESNTRTNLSAGMEYTLTLNKGDYNNRFFIEISPIQQTPTDIEYVENSHDDQARKVLIDNILYIVRDGQIFDARGARLK